MKRKFLLVSLLLAIASGAVIHAHQERGIGPGILWRRYTVKDEEFSVILPMLPAMATTRVARKSDNKIRLEKRLLTANDGVYYRITAFENPKPKQSLEQLIDELGLTGEFEFDPASKRRLSKDGFKGIEYSATEKSPTAIVQFFATENHFYRFIASGTGIGRSDVTQFFSSIKLGRDPEGIAISDGPGAPIGTQAPSSGEAYTGKAVDVKARLLTHPEPRYTEDARKNGITGVVVLKVVFAGNGKVQNIRIISGLPYGLTEQAIIAARQIKFTPAMKNGKPVSMWMQLEYNFAP
jgi:TonB family protein